MGSQTFNEGPRGCISSNRGGGEEENKTQRVVGGGVADHKMLWSC
jgi:hypothetical protein